MTEGGILEASETISEEPAASTSSRAGGRSHHARTGSGPGLWGETPMCQSPPGAWTAVPANPSSPAPLYPADDMVNRMVNASEADDERLTEDQILALYSGRSPVMMTPLEREPFSFEQTAKSPATTPSSKQTTPRRNGVASNSPTLAPALPQSQTQSSSTGGGLTSLFRKGSKFVRRGDHGETSRSKGPMTSPDARLNSRTMHAAPPASDPFPGPSAESTRSAQGADNGRKARTHTRQAASLEPTAWREQFLKSGMLNMPRPAPKSASQGNLA